MTLIKVTFKSIDDLLLFIQKNKLTKYIMYPAERYIITEDKPYSLPNAFTLEKITEEEIAHFKY